MDGRMSVVFPAGKTQRFRYWTQWKADLSARLGVDQTESGTYLGSDGSYHTFLTVYFYDGPEIFYTYLWDGPVPPEYLATYSQAQNNTDLAEYNAEWAAKTNKTIDARSADGRSLIASFPATLATQMQFCGDGDVGGSIEFDFLVPETQTKDVSFAVPIEVGDGSAKYSGSWTPKDKLSFGVFIAANPGTSTPGTGNANVVSTSMGDILVPAAGDGSHTIDLAAAHPTVLNVDAETTGFWWVDKVAGTITPAPGQNGNAHLLVAEFEGWLVRSAPLGAPAGTWEIDTYRSEYVHQNNKLRAKVVKVSAGAGILGGQLTIYRLQ
jgi:hypothetical protein